jgi:mRNA interferase MazF
MTPSVSFPEIYLCDFPFTSGTASKKRPCLVLFDLGADVLIARITSVLHTEPHDLSIRDWQQAGLLKASTVRLARLVTIERSLLFRRLGSLSTFDQGAVAELWQTKMRLGVFITP